MVQGNHHVKICMMSAPGQWMACAFPKLGTSVSYLGVVVSEGHSIHGLEARIAFGIILKTGRIWKIPHRRT